MCNWGWALGPVSGLLVQREKDKATQSKRDAERANQELKNGLDAKNKELDRVNQAANTDPIKSTDSLTNNSTAPKRTISTLSLPFRGRGLNVR